MPPLNRLIVRDTLRLVTQPWLRLLTDISAISEHSPLPQDHGAESTPSSCGKAAASSTPGDSHRLLSVPWDAGLASCDTASKPATQERMPEPCLGADEVADAGLDTPPKGVQGGWRLIAHTPLHSQASREVYGAQDASHLEVVLAATAVSPAFLRHVQRIRLELLQADAGMD